ncbi:MAG: Maf family protein [Candidatus Doudnabacteria bacterium]
MRKIILASNSPRRRELLEKIGLKFEAEDSGYTEKINPELEPKKLVKFLSLKKAKAAAKKHPNAIIIAADTLVVYQDKILGKPKTLKHAHRMLQLLNNKKHSVFTGFTILDTKNKKTVSKVVETKVYFRNLSKKEIENYIQSEKPLDKAGAYAIQNLGELLIKKIEGDYSNVVGLPMSELAQSLKRFNVNLI